MRLPPISRFIAVLLIGSAVSIAADFQEGMLISADEPEQRASKSF
jgi:Tfp pilus assembly protein PilN